MRLARAIHETAAAGRGFSAEARFATMKPEAAKLIRRKRRGLMSATGRAVRISSGPRYRLVATLPGGDEATRAGFESMPAAQAEVGAFVCDVAQRGRPSSIRVERVLRGEAGSNGKSRHESHAAGETLRRWDATVINRILGQQTGRASDQSRTAETQTAPTASPATPEPAPAAAAWSDAPVSEPVAAVVRDPDAGRGDAGLSNVAADAPARTEPELRTDDPIVAPASERAVTIEPEVLEPTANTVERTPAVAVTPPAEAAATIHAPYRPHHRRTRWVLILTAAFIAILFGGMILLVCNGDPVGCLRNLGSGEKIRETLPFRNGDGPPTKPAGRK
jgi:hypothetical protein